MPSIVDIPSFAQWNLLNGGRVEENEFSDGSKGFVCFAPEASVMVELGPEGIEVEDLLMAADGVASAVLEEANS